MGAIAVFVAATELALLGLVTIAGWLCSRVLRDGGDFEAEVRALSLAFRVRGSRTLPALEPIAHKPTSIR